MAHTQSIPAPLLVVVGPTAVGKTTLALHLARRFEGEIISADSRLFYQGLDIGTAKPTRAERAEIPHHLIDICRPEQIVSLGEFQDLARAAIRDCHDRNRLPILTGGSGQYVMAILEGWGIPRVPPQPALRRALARLAGNELTRWLSILDPVAAARIDPRNIRRVVRALEVTLVTGQPFSSLQRKKPPPWRILTLALWRDREALYDRIDRRVDVMFEEGLLKEVAGLLEAGYGWDLPAMSSLGYRQLRPYFEGRSTLEESQERIRYETHRLARQQDTWFRRDDPRLSWLNAADPDLPLVAGRLVATWLGQTGRPSGSA